jgi:hypothetical protein
MAAVVAPLQSWASVNGRMLTRYNGGPGPLHAGERGAFLRPIGRPDGSKRHARERRDHRRGPPCALASRRLAIATTGPRKEGHLRRQIKHLPLIRLDARKWSFAS